MNSTLQQIFREFDLRHDMDRIAFRKISSMGKDKYLATIYNAGNFLFAIKHVARGNIVGSLVGAFASAVTGHSIADGARDGFAIGAAIDGIQFMGRTCIRYIGAQIEP